MNNKRLTLIIVVIIGTIILIALGIIRVPEKIGEYTARNVTFGDECNKDEDCGYSFKTCGDGSEVDCENECSYGRCIKCMPICRRVSECKDKICLDSVRLCPNGSTVRCTNYCDLYGRCTKCMPKCVVKCYNETCLDSVMVCPDGIIVRCTNYCELNIGECTSCTPRCNITVRDNINYQLEAGGFILDAVPWINIGPTERKEIKLRREKLAKIELPPYNFVVIEPFSVDYDGPLDLTLSIPDTYTDVKALKCVGEDCNSISVKYASKLRGGGERPEKSKESLRKDLRKEKYLEPRFMPIKIKEINLNVTSGQEIISSKYKVRFSSGNFSVTLSMPKEAVEEPKNPSLKITGTPLIIKIKGEVKDNINSTVTMPYINLEGFEEDSIGMYAKANGGWEYLGGEIDKGNKTVTATIINISNYLDEKNEIELALMAVLCISCYGSSLTKVYQPEEGSKDVIILIHGFNSDPNTYQEFIDDVRLTNQPFEVLTFNYPSSKPIMENMRELMSLLEKNHANYKNIYIVAHSVGGLIIQQALYNSYLENKGSMDKGLLPYKYLEKIRKVILVATSNEGSPVVEVYRNLFKNLINSEEHPLFNPKSEVMNDLAKGVITPRVPGIDYRVIAGTKTYEFNLAFFKLTIEELVDVYEKNDGIITVKSAQHVGDKYINNQCKDYWEINLTHTELIDDPLSIKIMEKIISEDIYKKGTAILGHNKYFDLSINDSLAGDTYVIIGKKIREEEVLDETGCSCGNGYCGEGENETNCPSDCAKSLPDEKKNEFLGLIIILAILFICFKHIARRRASSKK